MSSSACAKISTTRFTSFGVLSIKPIGSSTQEVSYYALLGADYYAAPNEPPGEWWGRGAKSLGLEGQVDSVAFQNLLRGFHPSGRRALVQNAGKRNRRAAFDLTFSLVKSASALWSQCNAADRKKLENAAARALLRTLDVFDEMCGVTRRGKHGNQIEQAGLAAAIFKHETARGLPDMAPDPNIHFHVVVANAVVRTDGTTGAFDARPLFRRHMKMALGAMFRAELSKELMLLGLETYRPVRSKDRKASWFELTAVPQSLIDEFSKRRKQIENWLAVTGQTGAKAAEAAAQKTRRSKQRFTHDELFTSWLETGRRLGFHVSKLIRSRDPLSKNREFSEATIAVKAALYRIMENYSHFSELLLLRFTAEESQCRGVGINAIRRAVVHELEQSDEIVRLRDDKDEACYTTKEMLQIEKRMLRIAGQLGCEHQHTPSRTIASKQLANHPKLRNEQVESIRHITVETGSIACLNGMAGTGKTYSLCVAKEIWEQNGNTVVGTALAATAAKQLEEGSGIKSVHIHKLLQEIEQRATELSGDSVLVVDEAGMVGTRQMAKLLDLSHSSGAKLVLVGDHKQLQAIEAGAPFRAIAERVGVAELTEIIRQQQAWTREAVQQFAEGSAEKALEGFANRGLLTVASNRDEAMETLAKDWAATVKNRNLNDAMIFAGTNLEVVELNRLCQQQRFSRENLRKGLKVGLYDLHEDDRVVLTRNNAAMLIRNGSMGKVVSVDVDKRSLQIQLDEGHIVQVNTEQFGDIALGYCVTGHRGQGKTVNHAFVLTGGAMTDREMSYVQGSRARLQTRIYTDVVTGGPDIAALAKQMNRSRPKDMAIDYMKPGE